MKAAYLTGIRQVEVRQVPEPAIKSPDEVLLRVVTVGVCGSDMHYYRIGRIGSQVVQFPWSVGHECSAVVQAVGGAVQSLRVGQRVVVDPLIPCGRCDQCLAGRENTCRNQKFLGCPGQAPGAIAEQLVMPEHCCFPIRPDLTMTQAALVEPLAIGLYSYRLFESFLDRMPAAPGDPVPAVGILGAGPIGLSVLLTLKALGPLVAHVTDIRDNRLTLARRLGADWVGNPRRQDVVAQVRELRPQGLACVFECAGQQETVDQALDMLSPGGLLALVGIPEEDRLSFAIDLLRRKELVVQNVRRQNHCTRQAIELVQDNKIDMLPMVTHQFTLDQTPEAFDLVADYRDGVVKAIIHVGKPSAG